MDLFKLKKFIHESLNSKMLVALETKKAEIANKHLGK